MGSRLNNLTFRDTFFSLRDNSISTPCLEAESLEDSANLPDPDIIAAECLLLG
jgi:hypothetical protein